MAPSNSPLHKLGKLYQWGRQHRWVAWVWVGAGGALLIIVTAGVFYGIGQMKQTGNGQYSVAGNSEPTNTQPAQATVIEDPSVYLKLKISVDSKEVVTDMYKLPKTFIPEAANDIEKRVYFAHIPRDKALAGAEITATNLDKGRLDSYPQPVKFFFAYNGDSCVQKAPASTGASCMAPMSLFFGSYGGSLSAGEEGGWYVLQNEGYIPDTTQTGAIEIYAYSRNASIESAKKIAGQ
jgi:hypothetical protein